MSNSAAEFPVHIEHRDVLVVAGMQTSFIHALSPDANNLERIGDLWDRFLSALRHAGGCDGATMYGIITEQNEQERTHPDELRYTAAVCSDSLNEKPDEFVSVTVPEGDFAVVIHRGPIQRIGDTVGRLYREWLPSSGYQHAGVADVEVYGRKFDQSESSEMEYLVSVTRQ